MTVDQYLLARRRREQLEPRPRPICPLCRKPTLTCYCARVTPWVCPVRFVILIHPLEARKGVATGRMAYRCLANSSLIEGVDFSDDERVSRLVEDPALYPVLLFPGPASHDLTEMAPAERRALFPPGRQPMMIVLDGTWSTAGKMRRHSRVLHGLPTVRFTPPTPSGFKVRRQPRAYCYSTIEAIHLAIELLAPPDPARPHDRLLDVFRYMVEQQVEYVERNDGKPRRTDRRRDA